MKAYITLLSILFITISCNSQQFIKAKNKAVIELFTSEGCSSCPPAEKYLGSLAKADTNIILLSFHVDYWNKLGWVDSFSNNQFTQRQYDYGNRLHLQTVYTPQAVVNGIKETTGNNAKVIQQYVQQTALATSEFITGISVKTNGNTLTVQSDNSITNSAILYEIFLVEKSSSTHVMAGENEGATLLHTNVVRAFNRSNKINATFHWNTHYQKNNFQIVVLARDAGSYAVKDVRVQNL